MTSPELESLRQQLQEHRLHKQQAERKVHTHSLAIGVLLTKIAKEKERIERENLKGER